MIYFCLLELSLKIHTALGIYSPVGIDACLFTFARKSFNGIADNCLEHSFVFVIYTGVNFTRFNVFSNA